MSLAIFGRLRRRSGKKRSKQIRNAIALLMLLLVLGLLIFLNSNGFQERVRQRVIAELELITGGKVEIQSFTFSLSRLQFEIDGLTIHGLEPPGTAPYVHADHLFVRATVTSWFSQQIALRYVAVDRPVIHLIVFPGGGTNQPVPKVKLENKSPIDHLFELAINRMEIRNGALIWNQQAAGFDVTGQNLSATMLYSANDKTYDAKLNLDVHPVRRQQDWSFAGRFDAHFVLHPAQAEIQAFQFKTARSDLEGNGTVVNYGNPQIALRYTASIDLPEFGPAAKIPELHAGNLTARGTAVYSNQNYSSQGDLSVKDARWSGAFPLSGIELTTPFSLTPERISFDRVVAHVLGGTLQGDVQVVNWNSLGTTSRGSSQKGTAALAFSGLQVSHVASAISGPHFRTDKLNLVGTAFGHLKVSWTGSLAGALTEIKLESNAPASVLPQQVPVTAQLQATYHGGTGVMDVAGLSLATRAIRLNATGTLGSAATRLNVAFNATDLHELQPMLAALSPGTVVPASVAGRTSFTGSVFGKLHQLSAQGHLDAENFETVAAIPASSSWKIPPRIHWDSLVADLVYTPQSLTVKNGALRRGTAQAAFSGAVSLSRGSVDQQNSQITADVRVQNANVDDLKTLAGFNYPVTGILSTTMHIEGRAQNLRTNGTLLLAKMTLYGEPFRQLRADFSFAGSQTQFTNILIFHNGTQFSGSAGYNLQSRQLRFDVRGVDIELAGFRRFEPQRITMEGRADFHATGSGTPDAPIINAQLTVRNVVLNGEHTGDLTAQAETRGTELHVRAHSTFESASFDLDGNIHLRDDFPGVATLTFEHLDFDPLITAYLQGRITEHSSMRGVIEIRGPMKYPRAAKITANIDQLSADVENVRVHNVGPIRFSVEKEVARVEQFRLSGDETEVSLRGSAQLSGAQQADLHADGRLNLKLLQTFNPGMVSSGNANLTLDVTGSLNEPQVRGRLDIADGSISFTDLPNGLSRINGRLVFARDRMQIENLTAHSGGGELNLGGFVAYRNGVYFDVNASSHDVRLRYPPGISASANADLRYTGSLRSSQLSGDVTITRFSVNPRFDFAQYLALGKSPIKTSIRNPFLDNLRLDVHVLSTPELRVETSLAKLSGDVNLRLRGTVSNPVVLGRVNIVEGDIFFNSTKYRLERGDISFNNPLVIDPVVDVNMTTRVRGYDITIGFHGPVDHLSVSYRSEPPLPSGDIIALLAFGRTRQDELYTSQSNQGLSTAVNTFLGQAVNSASNSRVQKLFGVSRVKIDPQVGGPENNPSPRVTIEQQLNNNITVTYVTNISQSSSQQLIQVEYNVTRNISIVAVRDQNGILSFDVHYRQRKR
ncbi:MAG TPA: translocation/assembly module TamB domain-containing protein [Candidatus Angelobacter sp.]|nr:translocation/assembly module TamB domain-containing protein [Candidatus Angelobacter sp.]